VIVPTVGGGREERGGKKRGIINVHNSIWQREGKKGKK